MATLLRQCRQEEGHLHKGVLPPLREFFLEIQVNKLINDYLLSSTAEERSSSSHYDASSTFEFKENIALSAQSHASQGTQLSVLNVPCGKLAIRPFHERHRQTSHESQRAQKCDRASNDLRAPESHFLHSGEWSIDLKNSRLREEMVPYCAQMPKAPHVLCDVSAVTLSIQNEGDKTAYLSRADTFPCTSKAVSQMGGPFKSNAEVKVGAKKPPRPPKLPNSDKVGPSLARCFSETGTLSQSSRRAKLEKKRHSSNTSLWALLFTLCFAVLMIGQGFLSLSSQDLATFSTNISSPAEMYMKSSRLVAAKAGDVGASKNFLPSGERVKRKVQAEHLSHMVKHLNFGT